MIAKPTLHSHTHCQAPRANAKAKALSKSLQSLLDLPTGHCGLVKLKKNKINLRFVDSLVRFERLKELELNN